MRFLFCLFALALAGCETMAPAPNEAATITLERSLCFGACPDYTVTITDAGDVTYEGRRFVRVTGVQHAHADRAAVAHLFGQVRAAHFFDLNERYTAPVTDLPTYTVTVAMNGRTKRVVDYAGEMAGMPHAVREIEIEIDRVAGTAQWVAGGEHLEAPLAPR